MNDPISVYFRIMLILADFFRACGAKTSFLAFSEPKNFRAPAARENMIFGRFGRKKSKNFRAFGAKFLNFLSSPILNPPPSLGTPQGRGGIKSKGGIKSRI